MRERRKNLGKKTVSRSWSFKDRKVKKERGEEERREKVKGGRKERESEKYR